ncbi:MAG: hypothetical protein ACK4SF_00325 [Algoriphagus aquaeductus]|uniref:hypothetical protein n=1 Tax=Algoriphagus aquaeductus TaxID=475299 RepID=UPI003918EDE2
MKIFIKLLAYICIPLFTFSCEVFEEPSKQEMNEFEFQLDSDFIEFLKVMGYDEPENLTISKTENDFIINHEIIIHQRDFDSFLSLKNSPNFLWRKSNYTFTTPGTKRNIGYIFYDNFSTSFKDKVIDAFNTWNQIRNFNINFIEVDDSYLGDVVYIFKEDPRSTTVIQVNSPWNSGSVGDLIVFSEEKLNNLLSPSQAKWALVYTVGRLIGIGLESESSNSQFHLIPGTRVGDPTMYETSITSLYYGSGVPNWAGFYYSDLLGIRYLWPHDTSEKPLYSYLKTATGGFNWTTNWNLYQYGASGFNYWGVNGYIYSVQKNGTVPLYRYRHNVTQVDYLSLDPNLAGSFPSYVQQEITGYVFTSSSPDRIPIYEWYHPNKGFYFTTLTNDGVTSSGGWTGGGIAFYALKLDEFN